MTALVVGVNHRSAPVAVLDRVALDPHATLALLRETAASEHVAEAMVLSTCNRVEVYADVARFHGAVDDVTALVAQHSGIPREDLVRHLYVHYDDRAVQHMYEVAAGLDSMVVGEQQILGQVRASLRMSQEAATAGRLLNDLGQSALRVGKRVHTETGIDRAGASVVSVALDEAAAALGPGGLSGRRALVVGAGAMSSLAAASLVRAGVSDLVICNRTAARARHLAEHVGARWVPFEELPAALADTDAVVSCTGAAGLVLQLRDVAAAVATRQGAPFVVADLALPHDTDPEIVGLPGVVRVDLAALAELPAARASEDDVAAARAIVAEEATAFAAGQAALRVEPVVVSLRARAARVVEDEIGRLRLRLPGITDQELHEVERAMRRATATLLHTPTVRVKQRAADPGGYLYAEVLHELFDLDSAAVDVITEVQPAVGDASGATP